MPARSLSLDVSLLTVRVVAGIIFTVHGTTKLFAGGVDGLVEMLGPLGYLVAIGEFFGGLGLIVGFLTRFSAASLIVIMLGAIAMVHGANGFLLSEGGFEYNLALIGLMVPTLLLGPGRLSAGRFLPLPKSRGTDSPILPLE